MNIVVHISIAYLYYGTFVAVGLFLGEFIHYIHIYTIYNIYEGTFVAVGLSSGGFSVFSVASSSGVNIVVSDWVLRYSNTYNININDNYYC